MTYFEDHLKLAKSYNTNQEVVPFDDEGMVIINQPFYSRFFDMFRITDNKAAKGGVEYALLHDKGIRENSEFSYPVLSGLGTNTFRGGKPSASEQGTQ
jgi:hypothetical protein